jgi:hypothetical protein
LFLLVISSKIYGVMLGLFGTRNPGWRTFARLVDR